MTGFGHLKQSKYSTKRWRFYKKTSINRRGSKLWML